MNSPGRTPARGLPHAVKGTFKELNAANATLTNLPRPRTHALKGPLRESDAAKGPFGAWLPGHLAERRGDL
ncbi:hypothetical protein GCM10009754_71710 [Amycolatopsis minnesotensis]|uniref:Uncharacterized protein n=1 Tax=Amycolatopsis minnesotensis TaxID=337894 RepID=A0ABN2SDL1_9PSEU